MSYTPNLESFVAEYRQKLATALEADRMGLVDYDRVWDSYRDEVRDHYAEEVPSSEFADLAIVREFVEEFGGSIDEVIRDGWLADHVWDDLITGTPIATAA